MNIQTILRQINKDLVPHFEEKLRAHLIHQDKEWLIEQIVRLTLDAHSLQENDRRRFEAEKAKRREQRLQRLKALTLNTETLQSFIHNHQHANRDSLIRDGYLHPRTPAKGTDLISPKHRTPEGERLLEYAKDVLFGLLFGDEKTNTDFKRAEREMLTLTIPRFKADALDFMKATTEYNAQGTWQDPDSVYNDNRADNVVLEVEFGEVAGEWIGKGVILTLSLINNLEVNEQILYGRMINVEQSTLIQ